jgi:hypothetical protein
MLMNDQNDDVLAKLRLLMFMFETKPASCTFMCQKCHINDALRPAGTSSSKLKHINSALRSAGNSSSELTKCIFVLYKI